MFWGFAMCPRILGALILTGAAADTWVDIMMRFKQGGYQPKRTIKLALTCGEETT